MNPYEPPNIPYGSRTADDSASWEGAKLEILSITFGITFLVIVILLALYRESSSSSTAPNALICLSGLRVAPLIGVIGGGVSCVLVINFHWWRKRLANMK